MSEDNINSWLCRFGTHEMAFCTNSDLTPLTEHGRVLDISKSCDSNFVFVGFQLFFHSPIWYYWCGLWNFNNLFFSIYRDANVSPSYFWRIFLESIPLCYRVLRQNVEATTPENQTMSKLRQSFKLIFKVL